MISVIFDMDGTLTDTQSICIPAWDYAGELQGFKNMGEAIPDICGLNEKGWTDYLLKHYKGLDYPKFKADFSQYMLDLGATRLKVGALEILNFLKQKGVKMAIASGSPMEAVKHHLKSAEIIDYFDVIVSGEQVKNSKPHPEPFLLAAERLGVEPSSCFIFEDSPNGIKSGYAAGMRCIGVADIMPFGEDIKSLLFKECDTLDEAIPILNDHL